MNRYEESNPFDPLDRPLIDVDPAVGIGAAIRNAVRGLPEGYELVLNVRAGGVRARLLGPDGAVVKTAARLPSTLTECIRQAVARAAELADAKGGAE